jgi:hypothetical protein
MSISNKIRGYLNSIDRYLAANFLAISLDLQQTSPKLMREKIAVAHELPRRKKIRKLVGFDRT